MSVIMAYSEKGLSRDLTVLDVNGAYITPSINDLLKVTIGREGETPKLVVSSSAPTSNGSSIVKGTVSRLRIDASDLSFAPGVYTFQLDYFDLADGAEWKTVAKQVFVLEKSLTV